eukprot:14878745-Alexandrium_andersonii.AAC.1
MLGRAHRRGPHREGQVRAGRGQRGRLCLQQNRVKRDEKLMALNNEANVNKQQQLTAEKRNMTEAA